jgi:predicted AAA+ superfamily ATPase
MFQRKTIEQLARWKDKTNRKPLVLYGLRQVGKTWLMKEFGRKYFQKTVYISFDNNERAAKIFESDFNIERIIRELSIESDTEINADDTLIIFDEIQEYPRALTCLKYFNENAPQYHIISAGSLLGVMSLEGTGFPVGKVDMLTLYPMTFFEFMEAVDSRYLQIIKGIESPTLSVFHDSIMELLLQYFFVGGMPAAVKTYVETKSFTQTREVQDFILNAYYADFAKHIPAANIAKVRTIWGSVPAQLAKENKRFLYSEMKQGSRGRDYEIAMQWLKDARLVHILNRVSLPKMPLIAYQEMPVFKLYMPDVGLLAARTNLNPKAYIDTEPAVFSHYKGMLAEQFVLQELLAAETRVPIYYWASEKNTAEIEFVIQYKNKIIPLEVKSGKNIKSQSLKRYIEHFNPETVIRVSSQKYSRNEGRIELPLYMVGNIFNVIESQ